VANTNLTLHQTDKAPANYASLLSTGFTAYALTLDTTWQE